MALGSAGDSGAMPVFELNDPGLPGLCAELAAARRRIVAGGEAALAGLAARLTAVLAAGRAERASPAAVALLDEIAGLIGELEQEHAAARARLAALARHRRAGRSYTAGPNA